MICPNQKKKKTKEKEASAWMHRGIGTLLSVFVNDAVLIIKNADRTLGNVHGKKNFPIKYHLRASHMDRVREMDGS